MGYFVRPTIVVADDHADQIFSTEYLGPILAIYVFDDADFDAVFDKARSATSYALTGSISAGRRLGES